MKYSCQGHEQHATQESPVRLVTRMTASPDPRVSLEGEVRLQENVNTAILEFVYGFDRSIRTSYHELYSERSYENNFAEIDTRTGAQGQLTSVAQRRPDSQNSHYSESFPVALQLHQRALLEALSLEGSHATDEQAAKKH